MTVLYYPRPERWPQISLRAFFALVTFAGVVCWLGVQLKWIHDRHEALERYRAHHQDPFGVFDLRVVIGGHKAPWSIAILGERGVRGLPKDDAELARLFPETLGPD